MVFTLLHRGHVGAHLQKNFNELLLFCVPTWPAWPLSFESYRTEGHVSENHLYPQKKQKTRFWLTFEQRLHTFHFSINIKKIQ